MHRHSSSPAHHTPRPSTHWDSERAITDRVNVLSGRRTSPVFPRHTLRQELRLVARYTTGAMSMRELRRAVGSAASVLRLLDGWGVGTKRKAAERRERSAA